MYYRVPGNQGIPMYGHGLGFSIGSIFGAVKSAVGKVFSGGTVKLPSVTLPQPVYTPAVYTPAPSAPMAPPSQQYSNDPGIGSVMLPLALGAAVLLIATRRR